MTGIGQFLIRWDEETSELHRAGTYTPPGSRVVAHGSAGGMQYVACKIAGHHYYSGQGRPQAYAPAEFVVYEVIREERDGYLLCAPVLDWPVRS